MASVRQRRSERIFRVRERIDLLDFSTAVFGIDECGTVCRV